MTDKPRRIRNVIFSLFFFYILAILFILVVPNNYRGHNVYVGDLTGEMWFDYVTRNINLMPLRGIVEQIGAIITGQHVARNLIYLVGNMIGFMPLGFFLPALFVRERRFLRFLITILASIAALELTQVLTMHGSFDIDDIILNTIGACLGFMVARQRNRRNSGSSAKK